MPKPKEGKLDRILKSVLDIRERMFTREEFEDFKRDDFQPLAEKVNTLQTSVDHLAKGVEDLKQEKTVRDKTFARLSYRTEKLLGPQVQAVDAEFEDEYHAHR